MKSKFQTSLGNIARPCLYNNNNKKKKKKKKEIPSRGWCHLPVVPATREAEVGESLKPGRRRLLWAEIVPLHSSVGDKTVRPCLKPTSSSNN